MGATLKGFWSFVEKGSLKLSLAPKFSFKLSTIDWKRQTQGETKRVWSFKGAGMGKCTPTDDHQRIRSKLMKDIPHTCAHKRQACQTPANEYFMETNAIVTHLLLRGKYWVGAQPSMITEEWNNYLMTWGLSRRPREYELTWVDVKSTFLSFRKIYYYNDRQNWRTDLRSKINHSKV